MKKPGIWSNEPFHYTKEKTRYVRQSIALSGKNRYLQQIDLISVEKVCSKQLLTHNERNNLILLLGFKLNVDVLIHLVLVVERRRWDPTWWRLYRLRWTVRHDLSMPRDEGKSRMGLSSCEKLLLASLC